MEASGRWLAPVLAPEQQEPPPPPLAPPGTWYRLDCTASSIRPPCPEICPQLAEPTPCFGPVAPHQPLTNSAGAAVNRPGKLGGSTPPGSPARESLTMVGLGDCTASSGRSGARKYSSMPAACSSVSTAAARAPLRSVAHAPRTRRFHSPSCDSQAPWREAHHQSCCEGLVPRHQAS